MLILDFNFNFMTALHVGLNMSKQYVTSLGSFIMENPQMLFILDKKRKILNALNLFLDSFKDMATGKFFFPVTGNVTLL